MTQYEIAMNNFFKLKERKFNLVNFKDLIVFIEQFMNGETYLSSKQRDAQRNCIKWKVFIGRNWWEEKHQQKKRKDCFRQGHLSLG